MITDISFIIRHRLPYIFLLLSNMFFISKGQESTTFHNISSRNRLSQYTVNSILEDKLGFIWIGTEDGLNLYDGYHFKIFKQDENSPSSISSNIIWTLFEDKDGLLWIGTFNGLNSYDQETERFTKYLHNENDTTSISNSHILSITQDHIGNLWIGTSHGLNKFIAKEKRFVHYIDKKGESSIKGNVINSLIEDHLGMLWIGTDKGLNLFDQEKNKFSFYTIGNAESWISSMYEDKEGILWIGTKKNGLFRFNRKKELFEPVKIFDPSSIVHISEISEDTNGIIWAGTNRGLIKIDKKRNSTTIFRNDPLDPNSIGDNRIRSLYAGKNGFLWIGTLDAGVSIINQAKNRFHFISPRLNDPNTILSNKIRCFIEYGDESIMIGTRKGLGIYSPVKDKYLPLPEGLRRFKDSFSIISLCSTDNGNNIYVGTENNGMYIYNKNRPEQSKFFSFRYGKNLISKYKAFYILKDTEGILWIATDGDGLIRYDRKTGRTKVYKYSASDPEHSPGSNRITYILETGPEQLWLGTAGSGINILNKKTEVFEKYNSFINDSATFNFSFVISLHEDENNIWIGTLGDGLVKYDKSNKRFTSYSVKNGLPDNIIYGILEDHEKNLWLSHNLGITRFTPSGNTFVNYDERDGLQGNEFNGNAFLKTSNGTFFFGGNNGFNYFNPKQIKLNTNIPRIVFTDLKINNKGIKAGKINDREILKRSICVAKKVYLMHSDKEISIEFAALDFSVPGKNKYKYKINDGDWINLENANIIKFHKLPPGETKLLVTGSNNDGIWNKKGAAITFIVTPPFYQTAGFKSLMLLVIFLIIYLVYNLRTRSLKKQHKELQLLLETKTEQIKKQRDALAEKNAELAAINRDIIIERDKTLQVSKKLEDANRAKLQFFTNVSHEFRTPLTLILTPIENFLNNPSEFKYADIINDYKLIQRNAKKLLKLIDHLLQFRKYTTDQYELHITQNNLVDFIKNQATLFSSLAEQKHIDFRMKYQKEEIMLWFDQEHIEKVLSNLLSNAFKYTQDNGIITVATGHASKELLVDFSALNNKEISNPEDYAYFYVSDNGNGIPETELHNIFKRFYKAKGNKESGIGIGLHIVTTIIEAHSGEILVKSKEGEGSTFLVLLRKGNEHFNDSDLYIDGQDQIEQFHSNESYDPETQEEENDEPFSKLEKLSKADLPILLLVEDNRELRKYISKNLGNEYNIFETSTGEEALKILKDINPDIAICDVMLPGILNGFDLTEHLKSDLTTSHIPVILLTALSSEEQKIIGLEKGADVYLTKPFHLRELKAHLKSLLHSRETMKKKFREHAFLGTKELKISDQDKQFIQRVIQVIESNISNPDFAVPDLCNALNINHNKLYRKIRSLTDMTIKDFIQGIRLKTAAQLLIESDKNISEVAYEVGFSDPNYFGKCFKSQFGKSPSEFIKSKTKNE